MNSPQAVEVTASCRLHFGMLSFGNPAVRQYGGLGAMIDQPGLRLRMYRAEKLSAGGPLSERALAFALRFLHSQQLSPRFAAAIDVLFAPPEHMGLGSGTQLALAVAAGLNALAGRAPLTPPQLAASVGRGQRSAVGTYGFQHGGLLLEAGKLPGDELSPLVTRTALPDQWRWLIVHAQESPGLFGLAEQQAFATLPPVSTEITAALCAEAVLGILPAAAAGRFEPFSESLYRYGRTAGLCFAANQGGQFAGPAALTLIRQLRDWGIAGAGQSSWGPSVFAILPNRAQAADVAQRLQALCPHLPPPIIAAPDNHGAKITAEMLVAGAPA